MSKKQELKDKLEMAERSTFLYVYTELDMWLRMVGFRPSKYPECSTSADVNYWSKEIDSLYSVELYMLDSLNLKVRFMRDRNKHLIYSIGGMMQRSDGVTIDYFKENLLEYVKNLKDEKIAELNKIATL